MPFYLIPFALGLSFLLIWSAIGGMIFHDGQAAARRNIDAGFAIYRVGRRAFVAGRIQSQILPAVVVAQRDWRFKPQT